MNKNKYIKIDDVGLEVPRSKGVLVLALEDLSLTNSLVTKVSSWTAAVRARSSRCKAAWSLMQVGAEALKMRSRRSLRGRTSFRNSRRHKEGSHEDPKEPKSSAKSKKKSNANARDERKDRGRMAVQGTREAARERKK